MENLLELMSRACKKEDESILSVIKIFNPLVKNLVKKSNYCVDESDLIFHIIQIIHSFDNQKLERFETSGQIFNYIKLGIKNKYIQLLQQIFRAKDNEIPFDDKILPDLSNHADSLYEDIYIDQLLSHLTRLQKKIIIQKIMYDRTDVEISNELNISRQAVNRIKNRALEKLKYYL